MTDTSEISRVAEQFADASLFAIRKLISAMVTTGMLLFPDRPFLESPEISNGGNKIVQFAIKKNDIFHDAVYLAAPAYDSERWMDANVITIAKKNTK